MNTKILACLLAFFIVFLTITGTAQAKNTEAGRYFIKTTAAIWKNSFGVRNTFAHGFTADLTDWQLRLAKIFGIEVEKVPRMYVLPAEAADDVAAVSGKPAQARPTPSAQISWGVQLMYNNASLTKTSGGKDVAVAVLDTGILKSHPDLIRRVGDCKDFSAPKQALVNGKCDDRNGHGTHVAGIIAADGGEDGRGLYGIAPQVAILAYKVCDNSGSCWTDDVAAGIQTAADNGAQIINMSLGSDAESPLIASALAYAADRHVLVVGAAGNDGPYQGSIDYPAANPLVIGVGAIDVSLLVPDWSSRGINTVTTPDLIEEKDIEFGAPGVNIESTWKDGGYAILSGTSMAVPHIAGLAAKLWPATAEDPATEVRNILHRLARDLDPAGEDDNSGFGIPLLSQ